MGATSIGGPPLPWAVRFQRTRTAQAWKPGKAGMKKVVFRMGGVWRAAYCDGGKVIPPPADNEAFQWLI